MRQAQFCLTGSGSLSFEVTAAAKSSQSLPFGDHVAVAVAVAVVKFQTHAYRDADWT